MSIDQSRIRMIIRLMKEYKVSGKILTVGVQDVIDTHESVERLIRDNGLIPRHIPPNQRRYRLSKSQRIFKPFFKINNPMHGDDLFHMLGFDTVDTLDAFDDDNPSLVHDLNNPLPIEYLARYDFVLDIGCSEHIFDIRQSMRNLAGALKIGGVICYYVPMFGWHNECFYNFQPPLFFDAFAANGFDEMRMFINFFPKYYLQDKGRTYWREYQYGDQIKFYRPYHFTHLLFVARKAKNQDAFVSPLMTYYLKWFNKAVEDTGSTGGVRDSHHLLENLPTFIRLALPFLIPIYRAMPYRASAPIVDALIYARNWRRLRRRQRFWL